MTLTEEREALLRAVLDEPSEDAPRLIYADWLEEHARTWLCNFCDGTGHSLGAGPDRGNPECGRCVKGRASDGNADRAEFIRCQVLSCGAPQRRNLDYREWERLDRRGRQLLLENWREWTPRLSPDSTFEVILSPRWEYGGTPAVEFSRGFVEEIRSPLSTLLERGPQILLSQPVTRMVATDREPLHLPSVWKGRRVRDHDEWEWHGTVHHDVDPAGIPWGFLPRLSKESRVLYTSRDAALEALYAATLAECRERSLGLRGEP